MPPIARYTEVPCDWAGADIDYPKPGEMQVFYDKGIPRMVDFICPCGCGHRCPTHLKAPDEQRAPDVDRHFWNFKRDKNGVTLDPSIRWTGGCKAHFNITDGAVIWHPDSGK